MKKNIYLTIITLITVICIIAGSLYHILGYGLSFLGNFTGTRFGNPGPVESNRISVDPFDTLSIDTGTMDVTIKTGDDYSVEYTCNEQLVPKIESDNNTLTISQEQHKWSNVKSYELIVIVPEDATLSEVTVDTGVGDINISGLTIEDATFDTGVGDLKLKDCELNTCSVDSGTGDNTITDCSFNEMDIDSGIGDNKISSTKSLDGYSFDLDSGLGTIMINDDKLGSEYTVNKKSSRHISVDSGTGNITIKY